MIALLCLILGHRWVPVQYGHTCMVCTRCKVNGWQVPATGRK